jgi:hypothetical protein
VAAAADIRSVEAPAEVRIHWFSRDDESLRPGTLVLDAVRRASLPSGRFYTWVAGESRLATTVRRHLVNDRGVPKRDISFFGYWRLGRSGDPHGPVSFFFLLPGVGEILRVNGSAIRMARPTADTSVGVSSTWIGRSPSGNAATSRTACRGRRDRNPTRIPRPSGPAVAVWS